MLLSSTPRSETSRLAWLSQTPIAVASGRINQNSQINTHTDSLKLLANEDRYPHYQYSYVRTDIALKALLGSPLKRPLTLISEGYILLQSKNQRENFHDRRLLMIQEACGITMLSPVVYIFCDLLSVARIHLLKTDNRILIDKYRKNTLKKTSKEGMAKC